MSVTAKAILESLTTAVFITDREFSIVYANTAAEQLCGISRSRLYSYTIIDLIDKSETALLNTLKNTENSNDFQGFSAAEVVVTPTPGKTIQADVTICNYSQYPFSGFLVEMHVITHQSKLINQMQQSYQHTAARDLIRSLAHEIKNPLGGIRGAAQLIEMSYANIQGIKDYTSLIIEQSDRLKALVNRLLGPQLPKELVPTNVHYLIEKVLNLVKVEEESKGIEFIKDYDPSLPELNLVADSIEQVLLNIVNNAVQAMKEAGTKDPYVKVSTRANFGTVIRDRRYTSVFVISISNNGPEIPEKIKETVFYPMVTTKSNGNGLGLSIALNLIERHKGTIECLSDEHSTTFKIILPIKS